MDALLQVKMAADEVSLRYLGLQGAIEQRNRLIVTAQQAGTSQKELAALTGLSPQRIGQIIYEVAAIVEEPA